MKSIGQIYTYYCGANLTVQLEHTNSSGNPVTIGEVQAIQYQLSQNRLPLYGYNSPEFSAVADGQIIVNGRLHINYVSHEYLLAAIKNTNLTTTRSEVSYDQMSVEELEYVISKANDSRAIAALQQRYWGSNQPQGQFNTNLKSNFGRPDQHTQSLDIKMLFGDQNFPNSTLLTIKHVYFLGRSKSSLISEDPESETFDFLARTII